MTRGVANASILLAEPVTREVRRSGHQLKRRASLSVRISVKSAPKRRNVPTNHLVYNAHAHARGQTLTKILTDAFIKDAALVSTQPAGHAGRKVRRYGHPNRRSRKVVTRVMNVAHYGHAKGSVERNCLFLHSIAMSGVTCTLFAVDVNIQIVRIAINRERPFGSGIQRILTQSRCVQSVRRNRNDNNSARREGSFGCFCLSCVRTGERPVVKTF